MLLGLVKEGTGVAANVLKNLDVDLRKIRLEVEKTCPKRSRDDYDGQASAKRHELKKVIEYSMEEARNLNHNFVGTEHILLGLLREQEGVCRSSPDEPGFETRRRPRRSPESTRQ